LADGGLSDRRTFAQFDDVFPDGICLDAEGAVWIADPRGKRVLRVFDGGRVAETISTGERGSYACMLGGDDRCTLYICTNVDSGPGVAEARAGQIDAVRVTVPGAGLP
jgi:sugar lactone lactonase YvrE